MENFWMNNKENDTNKENILRDRYTQKNKNTQKDKYIQKDKYTPIAPEDPVYGNIFVDQVLKRFGINPNEPATQLAMRWNDIIGNEFSKNVFFEKIDNQTVYISCDNPSLASYVKLNGNEIMKKIISVFPELDIKKIVVRVTPKRRK